MGNLTISNQEWDAAVCDPDVSPILRLLISIDQELEADRYTIVLMADGGTLAKVDGVHDLRRLIAAANDIRRQRRLVEVFLSHLDIKNVVWSGALSNLDVGPVTQLLITIKDQLEENRYTIVRMSDEVRILHKVDGLTDLRRVVSIVNDRRRTDRLPEVTAKF